MSTSANRRHAARWLGAAAFCLVFFIVYDRFTYGARSPFLTWLFLWPLGLGLLPCLLFWGGARFRPRMPGTWAANLWNTGAAAVTVSSALRGILEIAGTGSVWQVRLMRAGALCLLAGAAAYAGKK